MTSPSHCPYRQVSLLQQALASDKMRVAFLLGAGCPSAVRVPDGTSTKPLIPDTAGLTSRVRSVLEASAEFRDSFAIVARRLVDSGTAKPTIEEILSHVRAIAEIVGTGNIDGLLKDVLVSLDAEICRLTTEVVKVDLPDINTPYHQLAAWVGGIQRAHPVEIFTPNYDLLAEQALEQVRIPYFDGFVGSKQTFFDLPSMEQDTLPARWARLWKVHGSINWWRAPTGEIERRMAGEEKDRQMIYPSHLKYDQSRRMPYLAMLDRLRSFLIRGQGVLITCGYSFADQHVNEVIVQGLSGNPTAVCFGLLYSDRANFPGAVERGRRQPNLSLLATDGAVLGTTNRDWHSEEKKDHPLHGLAVQTGDIGPRSSAPADRCKFLLGDFAALGEFLAQQLSQTDGADDGT